MGSVAAVAWGIQTPVAARLVLRPYVSFNLQQRALRVLRATKPRLSGSFVARIATVPVRGRAHTLVMVSRRVNGLALRAAAVHSILGTQLPLRRWVLTPEQTQAVKRAAARGLLALTITARYRVSYTNARGGRVVTPTRSASMTLPVGLKPRTAQGGNLRKLAVTFRRLLGRVQQLRTACVTRNAIVEELRNAYAAMVSGDRSGAAGLLQVYVDDAHGMSTDGLLNGRQASMLASGLGDVLKQVGSGESKRVESPRRWPPLPGCTPARAHTAGLLLDALAVARRAFKAVRRLIRSVIGLSPTVPKPPTAFLRTIMDSLWPADTSQPSIDDLVPSSVTAVRPVLDSLKARTDSFLQWEECCLATQPSEVGREWNTALDAFASDKGQFQSPSSEQVNLLPLFTEYENLYLSLLREGVVNGPKWGLSLGATVSVEDQIRAELNASNPSSAMRYSNNVYDAGLAALKSYPDNPEKDFQSKSAYRRDMQLEVLDFRDVWHTEDPMSYPYGDPSFTQDRIIYSDEVGNASHTYSPFSPPANPSHPLSSLTAWTTRVTYSYHFDQNWLTAIQADNSPDVGSRTGAQTTGTPTTYADVAPGSTRGPIVQVGTTWDQKNAITDPLKIIGTVNFTFSNGTTAAPGGNFYNHSSYDKYPSDCCTTYWTFDGEVLATAKIAGHYDMLKDQNVADGLVLGFRLADSFSSQWKGSLPGTLRAPFRGTPTNACLGVPQVLITSGSQSGVLTGSRTTGSKLMTNTCNGGWEQTWQYVDYNDPNNPEDDAARHELTVYAGTMCMAPATDANGNWATGGSFPTASSTTWPPPLHTLVAVYYCNGSGAQKWEVRGDGTIRPADANDLCLERPQLFTATIELNTCRSQADSLFEGQQWVRPVR